MQYNHFFKHTITSIALVFLSCFSLVTINEANATSPITGYKTGIPGYFTPVPDNVNFADYHYVGAHNAHVYPRFFTTVYQQGIPISDQLNNGVRGFMIDVYPPFSDIASRKVGPGNLLLSHGAPGVTAFSQKGFTSLGIVEYQTYQYELQTIVDFLKKYPSEIVIVDLEMYADADQVAQETLQIAGDLVFKPSDWDSFCRD